MTIITWGHDDDNFEDQSSYVP